MKVGFGLKSTRHKENTATQRKTVLLSTMLLLRTMAAHLPHRL